MLVCYITSPHHLETTNESSILLQLAAERLMNYWNRRIESFGPDKAFLPMTQKGALKDDWKALEYGFFSVLPAGKGAMGRGLVYVNLNREVAACEDKSVSRESMHRATWYMTHVGTYLHCWPPS